MEKRNGLTLWDGLILLSVAGIIAAALIRLAVKESAKQYAVAEPNAVVTNTGDSVIDTARGYYSVIGYSKTERGTGCITRYLDNRVATISIRIKKAEVENPEKKANELLKTAKRIIEEKGNKITHTEYIIGRDENEATFREYVVIFQPTEPNSPS